MIQDNLFEKKLIGSSNLWFILYMNNDKKMWTTKYTYKLYEWLAKNTILLSLMGKGAYFITNNKNAIWILKIIKP